MDTKNEYQIYCHFSAIGKKTIIASNLEEANQIVETDSSIQFDKIVRLTELCKVDESLSHKVNKPDMEEHHDVEYKSWGSE
jgi:hypothetical protein